MGIKGFGCFFKTASRPIVVLNPNPWFNRTNGDTGQWGLQAIRTAHLEKIEAWSWSCHTAFERTPLAPSKIPHSVQARNARFPSLRRHSSAIPVFSLHISAIRAPFALRQKDCSKFQKQTWKPSVNVLLVTLLPLSGTHCRSTWELLPPSQLSKLT